MMIHRIASLFSPAAPISVRTTAGRPAGGHRPIALEWTLVFALALLAATGCSARRPIAAWRQEVTRFVALEGNGDPACLRDTTDQRSRRTLRPVPLTVSSIAAPDARSRDASGVLVGECAVDGRPWYVFLVAIINFGSREHSDVESVQPIALTADAEGLHWFTPRSDDNVPGAYLEFARRQKEMVATHYATFPGPKDVFDMQARGGQITITEKTSGAQWGMQLPRHRTDGDNVVAATRPTRPTTR